jgi:glycosyltransferase involved in cell wall biosynthesis
MTRAPLVSILIPAYNAEKWIGETIRSALSQTWPNKEIIIVESGSTDNTLRTARQFESPTLKVLSQPNQGASSARNTAFSVSQGEYIQWLDADDLLAADKIARQMEVAASVVKRVVLSSEWGVFFYRSSKAHFVPTTLWADLSPVEWFLRRMTHNLHMQPATWLVSRELTEAAGPWDTRLSLDDDGEYFCRVVQASHGVRFVSDAKVFYRSPGPRRLSTIDGSAKKMQSQFLSIALQVSHFRALEDSPRVRAACLAFLQKWLFCFYGVRDDLAGDLKQLAIGLGGRLEVPQVRKKYRWIETIAGRKLARRVQELLPRAKWALVRCWDFTVWRSTKIVSAT